MRRRKRAAWIFNVLLAGPLFALYVVALTQERYQRHGFNWISALLTGLFVAALLLGRTEFHAVGDRSNPGSRWRWEPAACWSVPPSAPCS